MVKAFSSSRPEPRPRSTTKKSFEINAGQTSIDTHPVRAPEGKTSKNRVQIIAHSLYSRERPPPLQAERE